MHHYTYTAMALGVLIFFLMSTSASTIPVIVCRPGAYNDAAQKNLLESAAGRTQCFLVDKVDLLTDENYIDGSGLALEKHFPAGTKRQDVDHVFLRFGRN